MGYEFAVSNGYRVRRNGEYPWPCGRDKSRTIELFNHDILTRSTDGTFMKQTGIGCFGIKLEDGDVEKIPQDVKLRMM